MLKVFSSPQAGAHIVATIVVAGFIAFVVALAVRVVPESPLLHELSGTLAAAFFSVVQYYMGSSMGSAQKTAQISHLIGQAGQAAEAPKA